MLVLLMLALLVACRLAARGLGMRLERRAAAAGFVLPLLVLAPWLLSTRLLVPTGVLSGTYPGPPVAPGLGRHAGLSDVIYQLLPWELEVRHALHAGRLPLWSDRLEGGSSPWINPQAGALSPVAWLTRALPIQHHLLAALAFKMMIAFYGAWLLTRRLGSSRAAALLAAAGLCLGGSVMAWGLFPAATTLAWVPWVAAGAIGLCRRPRPGPLATTAALTAAMLLSGHPETALAGGCFAALCGLSFGRWRWSGEWGWSGAWARSGGERNGQARRSARFEAANGPLRTRVAWRRHQAARWLLCRGRGPAAAALAAALGFGLAAPQIVPFIASVPEAQRTREMRLAVSLAAVPGGTVATPHGCRPPHGAWFSPDIRAFLFSPAGPSVFGVPYEPPFRGPWDWPDALSGYAGVAGLAGAALAVGAARDRRAWPFFAGAACCLLLAAGFTPLFRLAAALPVLQLMAWPRLLVLTSLGLSIAAAFGFDQLLGRRRPGAARRGRSPVATAVALGAAAILGLAVDHDAWAVSLWVGVAAAAAIGWRRPRLGAVALGAVLACDLGVWSQRLLPREDAALFYPRTPFVDQLAALAGDPARWRAVGGDRLVYPSLLAVHGIAEVRPNGPLAPASYLRVLGAACGFRPSMNDYYAPLSGLDHPLLDFLGVRAVASSIGLPPPRRLVPADGGRWLPFQLFRNPHALPRWFFPTGVEAIERGGLEGWIGRAADQDPHRVAVWRDEAAGWRPGAWRDPLGVRAVSLAPGRTLLDLAPGGETLLATSLLVAGWSAEGGAGAGGERRQDGELRELRTLTVNGAFMGVQVPAGCTRVRLTYTPPGFRLGIWCCAGALALLAGSGTRALLAAARKGGAALISHR